MATTSSLQQKVNGLLAIYRQQIAGLRRRRQQVVQRMHQRLAEAGIAKARQDIDHS